MQLSFSLGFKELLKSQHLSSKAVFVSVVDCPNFYALIACKSSGSLIRGAGFEKQENKTISQKAHSQYDPAVFQ